MNFVRTKGVVRMLGASRTILWRMVQAGTFPRRVCISKRATGHVLEEVEAWMGRAFNLTRSIKRSPGCRLPWN